MSKHNKTTTWQEVVSGRQVDVDNFSVADVTILDMVRSLSLQCRYAGHLKKRPYLWGLINLTRPYVVSEHLCHVHDWVKRKLQSSNYAHLHPTQILRIRRAALLHDASETWVVDVPKPLKPKLGGYFPIEAGIQCKVAHACAFDLPLHELIVEADIRIVHDERARLLPWSGHDWELPFKEPLGIEIPWWSPNKAEREFRRRLEELLP